MPLDTRGADVRDECPSWSFVTVRRIETQHFQLLLINRWTRKYHSFLRSSSGNVAKFSLRDRERQRENHRPDSRERFDDDLNRPPIHAPDACEGIERSEPSGQLCGAACP